MPTLPTEAIHWYYRVFKPSVENDQLMHNNPEDWNRLRIWDGTTLKPAMPPNFSGIPSEEQINMLYSHVQNKRLFFFDLTNPNPKLLTADDKLTIYQNPKEPEAPPPFQMENATEQDMIHYNAAVQIYEEEQQLYQITQQLHQDNPGLQAAVDSYNSGRNMNSEAPEMTSRLANQSLQQTKNHRARADRVISQVMATRPTASAEVYYVDSKHAAGASIKYREFDDYLAPNGYDLPQNSKLDPYDAATINYAMMGVQSELQEFFLNTGKEGPVSANTSARNGFHYMTTGLFGISRSDQILPEAFGHIMQMGKESVEAYQNGDASLLGRRLRECVISIKDGFTGTGQYTVDASLTAASKLTERLMLLFVKKPDLWEATGLSEEHMDFLRGYAQLGKAYDNYLDSCIKHNEADHKGTPLTTEEKAGILADAVIRKMVENQLKADSTKIEESTEYDDGLMQAEQKDLEAHEQLESWIEENKPKFATLAEFGEAQSKQERLLDCNAHAIAYTSQPCDHPILATLGQPRMMQYLRRNLMQDPAILALASKETMPVTPQDLQGGDKLEALIHQVQPSVERSKREVWFDQLKAKLTQEDPKAWLDPDVASDSNRLMIAQKEGRNGKKLVNVASLLKDGLQSLQNPDQDTIDLLYENAKNGNLYFYGKNKDMPARLGADEAKASAQQLAPFKLPSLWQRFWNKVTFGRAYAKECNLPDRDPEAYELLIKARADHASPGQTGAEVSQPEQPKTGKYPIADTRDMTADDFFAHVNSRWGTLDGITAAGVLEKKDCQPDDYYDIVTRQLEAIVAKNIVMETLRRGDGDREAFLDEQKAIYPATIKGLRDYVVNHTDKNILNAFCKMPDVDSVEYTALMSASTDLMANAINGYTAELDVLNKANEVVKAQEAPVEELALDNQMQQQRAPFVKA